MDSEAASRGTTVYLVDKRIDMLPELLGTNLCSLRPFVERLAFSVIWVSRVSYSFYVIADNQELTPEAEIVNVRFAKSVIASKEAFTYEAAQLRKDDKCVLQPLFAHRLTYQETERSPYHLHPPTQHHRHQAKGRQNQSRSTVPLFCRTQDPPRLFRKCGANRCRAETTARD